MKKDSVFKKTTMISFTKKILFPCLVFLLFFRIAGAFTPMQTGCYADLEFPDGRTMQGCRINRNDSLEITVSDWINNCGADCIRITNNTAGDIFIPMKECGEWSSFLIHRIDQDTLKAAECQEFQSSGALELEESTKDSITLKYTYFNGNDVSLFINNELVETFGSGDGSGTYTITDLSPGTDYSFSLINGTTVLSKTLIRISFSTEPYPEPVFDCADLYMGGRKYKTVLINGKCWMAENINHTTGNSWCYDNLSSNCNIFGRLYDGHTALNLCPAGWRLPNREDWNKLLSNNPVVSLKSTAFLSPDGSRGTNTTGFGALPGGFRSADGNYYYSHSTQEGFYGRGYWWTPDSYFDDFGDSLYYFIITYYDKAHSSGAAKGIGMSVRCVCIE